MPDGGASCQAILAAAGLSVRDQIIRSIQMESSQVLCFAEMHRLKTTVSEFTAKENQGS